MEIEAEKEEEDEDEDEDQGVAILTWIDTLLANDLLDTPRKT